MIYKFDFIGKLDFAIDTIVDYIIRSEVSNQVMQ